MKITVKMFQGRECTVEVLGNTQIKELKQDVFQILNVPVSQQILLLSGKPLNDEKCIYEYSITEGTKINLIVKKETSPEEENVLRNAVVSFLRSRFSESDTQKVAEEFMKEFYRSMSSLNLEDIEKIATLYLEDERMS